MDIEEMMLKHKELRESQKYKQEIKYFDKLVNDFIDLLRICRFYSTRDFDFSKNSLLFNHTDEILESTCSYFLLIENGIINPVIREFRYILETSLKYLTVDQTCKTLNYKDKIEYFNKNIPKSSISCVEDIDVICISSLELKDFINYVNDIYKKLCKIVHPSKEQIKAYNNRLNRGEYLGFETEIEIKRINGLAYKVFEIIIVFYLTNLGVASTGDIFIHYLDDRQDWKFHKSEYIKKISGFYNYKFERQYSSVDN